MSKKLLPAALAVLLLASVLVLSKQAMRPHEGNTVSVPTESFMEDVSVVNRKNSRRQWSLNTKKATFPGNGDLARMQGVTLIIPEEGMTVRADSGLYNMQNGDLLLTGNVTARTADYSIRSGSINIQSGQAGQTGEDVLSTEEKVVVESRGFRIEGLGLVAKPQHKVRLLRDVRAVFF